MKEVYLLGPCRTAVGGFGGMFKNVPAVTLGTIAIKETLKRSKVLASDIDEVFLGNVLQAGLGQNPARQAAIHAGIPSEIPAVTVNKVCGSGLHSITLAYRTILSCEAECILAGGMENMSASPYVMNQARWGIRMNNTTMVDSMVNDGLWDVFNGYHMGMTAENIAQQYNITREMQDEIAARSQQRASAARTEGRFAEEIVPVPVPQRKGDPVLADTDEYIRDGVTVESLSKLRPAYIKDGTVTAGNASGINDGAAAVIVASGDFVKKHNLKPALKVVSTGSRGVDPSVMGLGSIPSVRQALEKAGLTIDEIDLFELNEAFAAQAGAVNKELNLSDEKVNVNGGAIAIGHPIGASGARILATLAYEMKRRRVKRGIASLCIGGGMGEAVVVELAE
jgi:acetyl-CoA C-acetyltransferase